MTYKQQVEQTFYNPIGGDTLMSTINFKINTEKFQHYTMENNIIPLQQQQQQQYSNIEFFYETPHMQEKEQDKTKITENTLSNFQMNSNVSEDITFLNTNPTQSNKTSIDPDYVQNLSNEIQHTKLLLQQYQLRTEQLMELVLKQTEKIATLRKELGN